MTKDEIIKHISAVSSRYGDRLLELMDYFNVYCLADLTEEQVKDYWQSHANEIERSRNNEQ